MSKHARWLLKELDGWVITGLVTPEQAEQIRALYSEIKHGPPWGTIIFSGLGAVIAGLGAILVLAYNWGAMPKAAKLGLIFFSLTGAHAIGLRLFRSQDWKRPLGDAIGVLGTMLFGAGIWLVAQIYHIEEHFPTGFFIWGLGALAMAWAMPSLAQALLAAALLVIWSCSEAWGFDTPAHWGPLLLLAGVGALAWRQQSRWLLFFAVTGFVISVLANAGAVHGGLIVGVALNLAALFLAVGILSLRHEWFPESAGIWSFFGWLGFLFPLFLLTFAEIGDNLLNWRAPRLASSALVVNLYAWVPFTLAVAGWVAVARPWVASRASGPKPADCPYEIWLVPVTVISCQVLSLFELHEENWLIAGVFNLVFLALTAAWMARGCREGSLRHTVLGSLMLGVLALARYFDLFDNLVARGVVFLLVGAALFVEGILFSRAKRQAKETGVQA